MILFITFFPIVGHMHLINLLDYYEIKFPLSLLVNDINGKHMIGSCDQNFILTKHQGILYADKVISFSIEVDSFYLCAALHLHTSFIILLCSALELITFPELQIIIGTTGHILNQMINNFDRSQDLIVNFMKG